MMLVNMSAFLTIALMGVFTIGAQAESPQVTLPDGTTLTGVYIPFAESEYLNVDTTLNAYKGIPFAEPPSGDLRFRKPVKKGPLESEYDSTEYKKICHQKALFNEDKMSEDCLYLNVFTSEEQPSNAPVLVWFHGGSFTSGGGSWSVYEPLSLLALQPNMVCVTVNYRLGVIGFLTTDSSASPGNYGIFDQIMALEWVQENIAAFGGDPSRVTIMGESAGGASVGLHIMSPLSAGLFNQAVMQSGNALCPWAVDIDVERQLDFTTQLAEMVNCTASLNEAMVDCLRLVDERDLVRAQFTLIVDNLYNELLFVPVVDNDLLPYSPSEIVKRKEYNSVPALIGTNEDEGTLVALRPFPEYVISDEPPLMTLEMFREELPKYLYYSTPLMAAAVEQWYIDWTQADNSSANQIRAFIDLNTDQVFACGTEATVRFLDDSGAPVYRYEMTHDPSWSIWAGIPGWLGAGHAEEIPYVFGWDLNPYLDNFAQQTDEERQMSVQFMRYWTNFIQSGI